MKNNTMKEKLLIKSIKTYMVASAIAFLVGIPVFYYTIQKLWLEDIDDSLRYQKEELLDDGIDENIRLSKTESLISKPDSIYFYESFDSIRGHVEPFREIRSYGMINGEAYEIRIRRDMVENTDLMYGILYVFLAIYILMLMLVLLISVYHSKQLWKPFYALVEKMEKLDISKLESVHINTNRIIEFDTLLDAINQLIVHNHKLFLAQKEFSENAAHELQTPLSVIRGKVNLLYSLNNEEKRIQLYQQIENQLKISSSICKNLLLLTKIDNNQYPLDEKVCISDIIQDFYDTLNEDLKYINKHLEIMVVDKPEIHSNKTLVQILFNNLLNNAVKYGKAGETVFVRLNNESCEIANTGNTETLDEKNIYKRFYRSDRTKVGTGLGLAVAKEIVDALHWQIQYKFHEPDIHKFTVIFHKDNPV